MELAERSSSSIIQNLYDENKMLGSTLLETVSKLEGEKIKIITKRNNFQSLINIKFEEIAKHRQELEEITNELDIVKSENTKELLKQEDLERKNILNKRAFNTQLDFQNAISVKLNQCLEGISALSLKDKHNTKLVEETLESFQDDLNKYKMEETNLQLEINEMMLNSRQEELKLHENITMITQKIIYSEINLEKLLQKCLEIEEEIKRLPFDEYKTRIDEGTTNSTNMQKKIHDLKTDFVMRIEEMKRKEDKEDFKLKHLCEELNQVKDQYIRQHSETQKISAIISELKQRMEELLRKNNDHKEQIERIKNIIEAKNEEKTLNESKISELSGTEMENESLKNDTMTILKEIDDNVLEFNEKTTLLEEIKVKEQDLVTEICLMTEKLQNIQRENYDIQMIIEKLTDDINNTVIIQNESKNSLTDEIDVLKQSIDENNFNLNEYKIRNSNILENLNKWTEEFQELNRIFDNQLKVESDMKQNVVELKQKMESIENENKEKLKNKEIHLTDVQSMIDSCEQILVGDLHHVPEEYKKLVALRSTKIESFTTEKEIMIANHDMMLKKIGDELTHIQNKSDDSLGIEKRRGETISEEIKKQNEKNNKLEEKCREYEEKIKNQERHAMELKKRIIARENKLIRASHDASVTRKELWKCLNPAEF